VDRRAIGIGVDLVENIAELQIEFIFGHIANVRRWQHVGMGEQRVRGIAERLIVKHVYSRMDSPLRDFGLKDTRGN